MDSKDILARLTARKAELQALVDRRFGALHHRDEPVSADFAEQATELEDREVEEALDDDARAELQQVQRALARVEAGTWQQCEECGEDIPPQRLNALPYATRCVPCAEALEAG